MLLEVLKTSELLHNLVDLHGALIKKTINSSQISKIGVGIEFVSDDLLGLLQVVVGFKEINDLWKLLGNSVVKINGLTTSHSLGSRRSHRHEVVKDGHAEGSNTKWKRN